MRNATQTVNQTDTMSLAGGLILVKTWELPGPRSPARRSSGRNPASDRTSGCRGIRGAYNIPDQTISSHVGIGAMRDST